MSPGPAEGPVDASLDTATRIYVEHRELLFSIVYNLLGGVADTEDVLQETWLAWTDRCGRPDGAAIENPRAYLVRIAVNQALARQAGINRRRETYLGPWLPEPLVADAAQQVERTESISLALLVVLETLSPLERAVFVLFEVFGQPHTEIAEILGKSPAAVRQLSHRARAHVHAQRPRFRADRDLQRKVTEQFIAAVLGGDLGRLMEILAPDVTLTTDGGGKALAVGRRAIHGRDRVLRVLANALTRTPSELEVRIMDVNGDPSAVLFLADAPYAVLVLDLAEDTGQITGIYGVTNPEKLRTR